MLKSLATGFTLIECLVALLIIAIVLASATKSIGQSVDEVQDNSVREVATWVADNQIEQYALDGNYPVLGISTAKVQMAKIDFIVTVNVLATKNSVFRRVEVAVSQKQSPDHIVYKTVGFVSQY